VLVALGHAGDDLVLGRVADASFSTPERADALVGKPGRFVFVPGAPDNVAGSWQGEAGGPPGCLRIIAFEASEDDEGLDVVAPQVVEGVLVLIRHPARGEFAAVAELQGRDARRARLP
jgi:hypothetical protein